MDIQPIPNNPEKLSVTFDNRDERAEFGWALPIYHPESWRANSAGGANRDNGPIFPYPREWPQSATFSRKTVARAFGMIIQDEINNPCTDSVRTAMVADISRVVAQLEVKLAPETVPAQV